MQYALKPFTHANTQSWSLRKANKTSKTPILTLCKLQCGFARYLPILLLKKYPYNIRHAN